MLNSEHLSEYLNIMLVDLHRHFGGSISCKLVSEVSGINIDIVNDIMVCKDVETYSDFFRHFEILDKINWDKTNTEKAIHNVLWDIKREGIDYAEIKFSVNKYINCFKESHNDIVKWFLYKILSHADNLGLEVDAILSLKHDMNKDLQISIADCIEDELIREHIAGIDVVGDENYFDPIFYKSIYDKWHYYDKVCMAHVGEIDNVKNVMDAIKILNVDRICHGIAACDNEEILQLSLERDICFDTCITSNIYTGVAHINNHPVKRMVENGFIISIGTDDPVIFNTNIHKEYALLKFITGIDDDGIDTLKQRTPRYSARSIIDRKVNSGVKI